jgi:hypothetical protein
VIKPFILDAQSRDKNINVEEFRKSNFKVNYSENRVTGTLVGANEIRDFTFYLESVMNNKFQ